MDYLAHRIFDVIMVSIGFAWFMYWLYRAKND